jgi:hypothetical protein
MPSHPDFTPIDYVCPGQPYVFHPPNGILYGIFIHRSEVNRGVDQGTHHWEMTFIYDLSAICGPGIIGESSSVGRSHVVDIQLAPLYREPAVANYRSTVQLAFPGIAGTNTTPACPAPGCTEIANQMIHPTWRSFGDPFDPTDFPPIIGRGLYRTQTGDVGPPRLAAVLITGDTTLEQAHGAPVPPGPIRIGDITPDHLLGKTIPTSCIPCTPEELFEGEVECPVTFSPATLITEQFNEGYGGGIVNMQNGTLLAYVNSTDDGTYGFNFNPQRLFRSSDNGVTWVEIAPYLEPTAYSNLSNWIATPTRLHSVGPGKAIVIAGSVIQSNAIGSAADGYLQEDGVTPGAGMVPYTEDNGATWRNLALDLGTTVGGVPAGSTFVASDGSLSGLTVLDNGEIWISGYLEDFNASEQYGFIKTAAIGAPWTFGATMATVVGPTFDPGDTTVGDGIYVGNDRVILGLWQGSLANPQPPKIAVTNDRGATWSQIELTVTGVDPGNILGSLSGGAARLEDGSLLISAIVEIDLGDDIVRMWRSVDGGETWIDISSAVPNLSTTDNDFGVMQILPLGGTRAIATMAGDGTASHNYWVQTEDGGVTWAVAEMNGVTADPNGIPQQMAIADDGSILTIINLNGNGDTEIWRGTLSGTGSPSCMPETESPPPTTLPCPPEQFKWERVLVAPKTT